MTQPAGMSPTRRRPIPGMASHPAAAPAALEQPAPSASAAEAAAAASAEPQAPAAAQKPKRTARPAREVAPAAARNGRMSIRRAAMDYATTRLVNFRLPVDLHDRYKQLVRDAELAYPRLRHPSFTEVLIALLEEGPHTGDEVAELIRRKRAAEHGVDS